MPEHHHLEYKSLRKATGNTVDWKGLARECVCFANARGGELIIGVEDGEQDPPSGQKVDPTLPERIFKRVTSQTINLILPPPSVEVATNGGEYLRLVVPPSSGVAATTDGRYYVRIADECKPVLPEMLLRLVSEKGAYAWETRQTRLTEHDVDPVKRERLLHELRASERVKAAVKSKTDQELLGHYDLFAGKALTQLGVLWIGTREARASLSYAPVVQFLRSDEQGRRVDKEVWDDFSLNPAELMAAVEALPVWREAIEVPSGLFRERIPNYDVEAVRELIANALVHRMYTVRGDVLLRLYPDRLEVCSPGPLPFGVTSRNILHKTVRRNEHLARLFHDLKLMEREGSGYDRLYQIQLTAGKPVPEVENAADQVCVTIRGPELDIEALRAMEQATDSFQLSEKEIITLGSLAQSGPLRSEDLADRLGLRDSGEVRAWLGGLQERNLVTSKGRARGTHYAVNPELLRESGYRTKTTLRTIEDHRLRELIRTDIARFPGSAISEIMERIGPEIPRSRVQRQLRALIDEGFIIMEGTRRWARYHPHRSGV